MESDIEKGKKGKRRRSARVYLSNAHPLPTPEQLAALVDQFPSDPDDDDTSVAKPSAVKRDYSQSERRRLAREGKALPTGAYPIDSVEDLHNAAVLARTGHGDVDAARQLIARRARELGVKNPLEEAKKATMGNAHLPDGRSPADARVSPPRVQGGAAPSTGDHGAWQDPMNRPGPSELAFRHPSMRQQAVRPLPLFSSATDETVFPRDLRMGNGIPVALDRLDAAGAAGEPGFRAAPTGSPMMRQSPHIAPIGESNGGHGLASPACPPPMSAKNDGPLRGSEAVAEMKKWMHGGGGRR